MPIGTVVDYAGGNIPATWYVCAGQNVSRTTFSELFNAIGTTYGSGDGATTFGLPDFRGNVSAGADNMGGTPANRLTSTFYGPSADQLGAQGGSQASSLTNANLPSHTHGYSGTTGTESVAHSHNGGVAATTSSGTGSVGGNPYIQTITVGQTGAESAAHTHSFGGTTDGGSGSNAAFANIQPTLTINKIIYAAA